ncbi:MULTISPECIES: response regulator transcription factor [Subtercola]|uniref:DNA-binding response regulator n=1 Tax=Subtercola vilae TaxID=2056433 RepID=A0A4T2CDB3_9MICO|nr:MULTISPECIES: response regulator transcription factor [Subtercola]MEA9983847.1 response regulator transcription factor [Subtercola sp. RTI3]TIH40616.1 DNA-binding response regulator [Subtercola vilae]
MARILVVEDDPQMGALIERGLVGEGHTIDLVTNGIDALIALRHTHFSAAAIDVMLPKMTGFELCRRIRESGNTLPIILLTARDGIEDRVTGLDLGADDYLTKPFAIAELNARLRAHIRRNTAGGTSTLGVGNLMLDTAVVRATVDGKTVSLSLKEFALLRLLVSQPGSVFSRQQALEEVWGSAEFFEPTLVDQYISYVRKKLETAHALVTISTVRGSGYRIDAASTAAAT